MFEPINFSIMNETDVREEILAPFIHRLGYRTGGDNQVLREIPLRYPYNYIGKKNHSKDPILRGKPDYILEAKGKVRWVLEAKAPDQEISADILEQAWSYANHAEVRAVYFAISNGRVFQLYQTNKSPGGNPIFSINYEDFDKNFTQIENILSPLSILRDNPDIILDMGKPLAPGFRSIIKVVGGYINYESNSVGIAAINQLQTAVTEGDVQRNESGEMIAYLRVLSPIRAFQELNEKLGLSSFEMLSKSEMLSSNPESPTSFVYDYEIAFQKGEKLYNLQNWEPFFLPGPLTCRVKAEAKGIIIGTTFAGIFVVHTQYRESSVEIKSTGKFELKIS
jgi:hypothetical protein